MIYEYDGGPKPKHYDNPMIVDQENFKKPPRNTEQMILVHTPRIVHRNKN